jgi:hypothetical protein
LTELGLAPEHDAMHGKWIIFAAFSWGCVAKSEPAAHPLLISPSERFPSNAVARLYGPIELVDGEDVQAKGTAFELLPGCHIVRAHAETIVGPVGPK